MVSSILQFPNEILTDIISRVFNGDLENFTLTSRRIHALAKRSLREHRIRQDDFRCITLGAPRWLCEKTPGKKPTAWTHPTLMLLDLVRDDLLYYPWVLTINHCAYESVEWYEDLYGLNSEADSDSDTDRYSDVDRALRSFADEFKPLIKACTYFNKDEELSRGVLEGEIGATLGLLLNVLPNLRTLDITAYSERSSGTRIRVLNRVLDRMLNKSSKPARGSMPSLGKLETVIFKGRDSELDIINKSNLSSYTSLLHFPSIRYFFVKNLRAMEDGWTYPGHQSHISRIEFDMSTMNNENLKIFLKTTHKLLNFKFQEGSRVLSAPSGSQVKEIAQTVLEQAGHRLRHLDILSCDHRGQLARAGAFFLGTLRAFRVLETIQINGSMLVEPVETRGRIYMDPATARSGQTRRFTDIFPSSIVRIKLVAETCVNGLGIGGDVAVMLQGLPERKTDLLPHLEVVVFELDEHLNMTTVESGLLHACNKIGVKILTNVGLTGRGLNIEFG